MRVLLATDGTKHSEPAVEMIKSFKFHDADEIKIVSVVDMAVPLALDMYSGYLPTAVEIENAVKENVGKLLETTRQKIEEFVGNSNVVISTEVLHGSPESRIVETAEAFRANLIIVGSHGYNRWERLLLGSVSDSVIHHAPCSVLVVRSNS